MRYLFIVTESASANGICAKSVMDCLSSDNEIYCVTNQEWNMPTDYVVDNIYYRAIRPRLTYRIQSMIAKKALGKTQKWLFTKLNRVMDRIKLTLTLFMWPLISPAYARRIEMESEKLCQEKKIDCIIPIYTQIDTLIAASRIKNRHKDILYVPYFLDSLSGGYGLKVFNSTQTLRKGLYWERKLLSNADWIIAMESSRSHHANHSVAEQYYHRIRYFDLPLLREYTIKPTEQLMDRECCNMVFVGTLPEGIRSPEYILQVLRHLSGKNYQFYFVGTDNCATLNETAKKDSRIHVIGRVSHEQALQYELQADVLLNIGNCNPNMTPSKIFEYMSFGKPIISTMPISEEPSRQYLERYPLSLLLYENDANANQTALNISRFISDCTGKVINQKLIKDTFYQNTPDAFASFLRTLDRNKLK